VAVRCSEGALVGRPLLLSQGFFPQLLAAAACPPPRQPEGILGEQVPIQPIMASPH